MNSLTIAGDTGTTEWEIEDTQTGPIPAGSLGEFRATGRSFRLRGASILMFQEGRIANITDYYDMATLYPQNTPNRVFLFTSVIH